MEHGILTKMLATLEIDADDTLSDRGKLLITWYPDDSDQNWTVTTSGPNSAISASWGTSGIAHRQSIRYR